MARWVHASIPFAFIECIRQWLNESSTCPSCKAPAQTLMRHSADVNAAAEVVQIAAVDNRQRGYLASAAEMQADADRREACIVCGACPIVPLHRLAACLQFAS